MRAVLLLVLLLTGCNNPLGPDIPGAVATEAHPAFLTWWGNVENDTGLTGDFDRISWYKVGGGPWIGSDGKQVRGLRVDYSHRIYIADTYWTDGSVIRHEMLHEILDGDGNHTNPLFQTPAYKATWKD